MRSKGFDFKYRFTAVACILAMACCLFPQMGHGAKVVEKKKAEAVGKDFEPMHFKGMLPEVLPIPGDPRPYEKSAHAAQIDKALAYLLYKYREPNRWLWLALLDYFQRQYGLHERYSLKYSASPQMLQGDEAIQEAFKRLDDPDFILPLEKIEAASPQERHALRALYCDVYPIDGTLIGEMIAQASDEKNLFLGHLGISCIWMRQNGCLVGEKEFMQFRDTLAVRFRNRLRLQGVTGLLSGEALALVGALGHREMLEESWFEQAAQNQNEDGGWPTNYSGGQKGESVGSVTVYMLWALLQHALPDVPEIPMIPRKAPVPETPPAVEQK